MTYSVEFEEKSHRYKLDGQRVPSVTTILGVLDKPGLPWWGMTVGIDGVCALAASHELSKDWHANPPLVTKQLTANKLTVNHVRDTAATRGASVHRALELYATNNRIAYPAEFPKEDQGYVRALNSFLLKQSPKFLATEVVVGSKAHQFAGRYDVKCELDGKTAILDAKTSAKGRIYDTAHAQIAGYRIADQEMGSGAVDTGFVLALAQDGSYSLEETQATPETFLSILDAYNAVQTLKKARKQLKAAA